MEVYGKTITGLGPLLYHMHGESVHTKWVKVGTCTRVLCRVSSADTVCLQFRSRSGPTKRRA